MPTPYTGDKTNTEPPSAQPQPGVSPILNLPADGDPPNASTFAQAFRVLADFSHWLMSPQSQSGILIAPLRKYLTARGHRMWELDHYALPAGLVNFMREDFNISWAEAEDTGGDPFVLGRQTTLTSIPQYINGWQYLTKKSVVNVTPVLAVQAASSSGSFGSRPFGNSLRLKPLFNLTDCSVVFRYPTVPFSAKVVVSIEFDVLLDAVGAGAGSADVFGFMNGMSFPAAPDQGIFFRRTGTQTTWRIVTKNAAGEHEEDTGHPISTGPAFDRLRVVWVGADVDDGSASRALFYVNGSGVGNITANIPADTQGAGPYFGCECTDAAQTPGSRVGGPVCLTNNTGLFF